MCALKRLFWILIFCTVAPVLTHSLSWAKDEPLVRNYLRVKAILKEDSPIYVQPSTGSKEVEKAKQYSIVFVFHPGGGGSHIKDGFYRVGKDPDEAIGWIPQERLREWDHRLCLHFTPIVGRQPALVYGSQEDADNILRKNTADKSKAAAEEPGDLSGKRYSMLLPVLADLTVTTSGQVKKAYQIGYLGGSSVGVAPVAPSKEGGSPTEIAILELMFVMDTTASMEPYIKGAKRVIESISNSVQKMREAGTRIGLLCYRDYLNNKQNQSAIEYRTKKFSPLTRDLRDVMNILENEVRETTVSSEDYPEAAFDGLYAAITETDWDKEKSSLRIVIWVGDASAHPAGHEKNPLNYSLDQIQETASKNRVRMIAIKIRSQDEDDNAIHREQMQHLATGQVAGDIGSFHEIEITENMAEEYVKKLTADIESEIARMQGWLIPAIKDPKTVDTFSSSEKAIILKNLKSSKTGADKVEFSEGWISELSPEGQPQVKPYVFMSFDDLALNIFYLNTAHTLAKSSTEKVQKSVAEIVHTQTGEEWREGESLAEHYQKKLGLPTTSNLLRFSLAEMAGWGEQRREDLAKAIQSKVKLMETHRDNPESWYKLGKKDFRYTFVPLDFLP